MAFATKGGTAAKTAPRAPVSGPTTQQAPTPALRPQTTHDLALPADLMAELAGAAKEAAAKERPAIGRISLKSGVMSYQGNAMPDNAMEVIIVGGGYRNVWYAGRYDADNIVNPNCFALAEEEAGMEAHENVPDESVPGDSAENARDTDGSARACKGCAMGEWGSSPTGGRGKACKQTRRLVMLPANVLDSGSPEDVLKSEMAILDVPVTSVKNYANLVSTLAATLNLPVWAVRTYVKVVPNAKTQFQVEFTPLAPAGDALTIRALMKRRDEAMRMALTPYDGVGGENDPDAKVAAPAAPVKNKFAAKKR